MAATDTGAVGKQVAAERERLRLSQLAVAHRAGVSAGTVSAIEAGRPVRPRSLLSVLTAIGLGEISTAPVTLPREVHLAQQIVAEWMLGLPEQDWPAAILTLTTALTHPIRNDPAGPTRRARRQILTAHQHKRARDPEP